MRPSHFPLDRGISPPYLSLIGNLDRGYQTMTAFADMPQGSLDGWLAWCGSHDWGTLPDWYEPAKGSGAYPWVDDMTGELVTYSIEVEADGRALIVEARHKTPRELKAWAGY